MIVIVMGVCGCGKTTVAEKLASELEADFIEGDDLHPAGNKQKMSSGVALCDEDRWPWLDAIAQKAKSAASQGGQVVISCSALKRIYRDRLRSTGLTTRFVHLTGSVQLLQKRMDERRDHFMPAGLLASQLAALEPPGVDEHALTLDIANEPDTLVTAIREFLKNREQTQ
jgi:gluconokinase